MDLVKKLLDGTRLNTASALAFLPVAAPPAEAEAEEGVDARGRVSSTPPALSSLASHRTIFIIFRAARIPALSPPTPLLSRPAALIFTISQSLSLGACARDLKIEMDNPYVRPRHDFDM